MKRTVLSEGAKKALLFAVCFTALFGCIVLARAFICLPFSLDDFSKEIQCHIEAAEWREQNGIYAKYPYLIESTDLVDSKISAIRAHNQGCPIVPADLSFDGNTPPW